MEDTIRVETPKDLTTTKADAAIIEIWTKELESSDRREKNWRAEAQKYLNIYRDQHQSSSNIDTSDSKRYNIFWSNTQTLRPLVFSKLPKSNITQRFLDKDEISRIASEMMERAINYFLDKCQAEKIFNKVRDDFLICGRGLAKVVYDPEEILELERETTDEEGKKVSVKDEEVDQSTKKIRLEYIDWRNYRMSTENEWKDIRWMAFRELTTKDGLIEVVGSEKADKVNLNYAVNTTVNKDANIPENKEGLYSLAEVWHIWDRSGGRILRLTTGQAGVLLSNESDDYNLEDFFPCPKPLGSDSDPSCLIPIPLYRMYKSQAEELNAVDQRIKGLIEQCKATGIYSSVAEQQDVQSLFQGEDGEMTPMKGTAPNVKVQDLVMFKPLEAIILAIRELNEQKINIINNIRDITGLADIIRGITAPSETATAQQIKGNFAISRIQPIQKEFEVYVRDIIRLLAELIVEKFSITELAQITNLKIVDIEAISRATQAKLNELLKEGEKHINPQDSDAQEKRNQLLQQAQAGYKKTMKQPLQDLKGYAVTPQQLVKLDKLIKDDKLRSFAIDVETESTIRVDQQQEKQDRIEYLTAIGNFANSFGPMVQGGVMSKDTFNEFLIFISKPYKVGRNLEESLIEKEEEQEPKPPSAEEMQAQADIQAKQQEFQLKGQDLQIKAQKVQNDANLGQQKINVEKAKVHVDMQQFDDSLQFEDVNLEADRHAKTAQDVIKARTQILSKKISESSDKQPKPA